MIISLTPEELFEFIYGNDRLGDERAWLARNTAAAGYCTVIDEDFALAFLANDPAEAYAHVEVYESPELGKIYTLWRPFEWNDSTEKKRLLKVRSSEWRAKRDAQLECELLVEQAVAAYCGATGATAKEASPLRKSMLVKANDFAFNVEKMKNFLRGLNAQFPSIKFIVDETTHTNG